jgi:hypothetical protein
MSRYHGAARPSDWATAWESARDRRRRVFKLAILSPIVFASLGFLAYATRTFDAAILFLTFATLLASFLPAGYVANLAPRKAGSHRVVGIDLAAASERAVFVPFSKAFTAAYTLMAVVGISYTLSLPAFERILPPDISARQAAL